MAGDINSSGQMVGNEAQTSASNQAWFYDGSAMHSLGTLSGSGSSGAAGINNNGLVVGSSSYTGSGLWNYHAFLYDGSMHDLGTLGGASSLGSDINDSGVIVGSSTTAGGQQHAYFYDGTMRDLGVLAGGFSSAASAINASGAIVGVSTINAAGAKHAVLWDGNTIQDLGALGAIYGSGGSGGDYASANDINSSGLVVGDSVNDDGYIPFLYDGATMFNLNDLLVGNVTGLQLQRATGINDKGQIIGMASNGHLYLLNPVPIPAAGWLMGSGLAGLVAARRYRRR
jgi:probable HAF family extracellular repeat protein